jgi:uncharacterized protein
MLLHELPSIRPQKKVAILLLMLAVLTNSVPVRSDPPPPEVPMGGVLPGGSAIFPHITTFKDQKYRNMVRQIWDFSCGAAALATVLKYAYGMDVTENQVFRAMYAVGDQDQIRNRGFSMLDMKKYLDSVGMNGVGYRVDANQLYGLRVPVIVLINVGGYEHFVVLRKATPAGMWVADPSLGNRVMERDAFVRDWVQSAIFAVVGANYDPNNVLVNIDKPLGTRQQVRALIPQLDPMPQSELSVLTVNPGFIVGPR